MLFVECFLLEFEKVGVCFKCIFFVYGVKVEDCMGCVVFVGFFWFEYFINFFVIGVNVWWWNIILGLVKVVLGCCFIIIDFFEREVVFVGIYCGFDRE